jgi:hypothetical protein
MGRPDGELGCLRRPGQQGGNDQAEDRVGRVQDVGAEGGVGRVSQPTGYLLVLIQYSDAMVRCGNKNNLQI